MNPAPTLVISGPVGVGKTSVGTEVSAILAQTGIPHTFIDLDTLTMTYPRPPDDRFGDRLALQNLRDVWINAAAAGSRNLIIARVIESMDDLQNIKEVLPNTKLSLCQLSVTERTLIERVRTRERGTERDWHEARAIELAKSLPAAPADFKIDTEGRSVTEVAGELVERTDWVRRDPASGAQ